MNLKEVRQQFINISGRTDLVVDTTDYEDNGANYFIREGMKELDRDRMQHYHSTAKRYISLKAGRYVAQITKSRAVNKVFCGMEGNLRQLQYRYYDDLRRDYALNLISADNGTPLYWAPINLRHSPDFNRIESSALELEEMTFDTVTWFIDVATMNYHEFNGVLVLPSPSMDVTLEIHGLFYSDSLENDSDSNYWTLNEPSILVMAAMRELERSYRNMTGAQEWSAHIQQKLMGLDMDVVEAMTASTDKMRG